MTFIIKWQRIFSVASLAIVSQRAIGEKHWAVYCITVIPSCCMICIVFDCYPTLTVCCKTESFLAEESREVLQQDYQLQQHVQHELHRRWHQSQLRLPVGYRYTAAELVTLRRICAVITIAIQLRYDYDLTTIRLRHIARACFHSTRAQNEHASFSS